ncbi:MFS transporter [Porticoccaceae bacterium]|nr:MFS transporter [Porticoccaceae bacterium]
MAKRKIAAFHDSMDANLMTKINRNADTLTQFQGLTYGLPLLPLTFLAGPITLLQGIYAKHFGLTLTTIATVLLIARLFDAVTDPVIGYCADRYYARRGNRKPFIIAGAVLFIISSWFLYVPFGFYPAQGHTSVSAGYFLGWFLAFYLAYTLFEIPHMAWGSELASGSREKNTVYGVRSFFFFLGSLLFFAMPLLPWFETTEFTPQTLKWSALVAGSLMLPMLYLCIKYVPNKPILSPMDTPHARSSQKESLRVVLRAVFTNKPLLVLTIAHICTGFGSGMYFTLLFIFVDGYLDLGPHFALVFVISLGLSLVALRLWFVMANRWGKQMTWISGMVLVIIGTIGTGLLSPEDTGWLGLLLCVALVYGGFSAFNIMVPSLLSDIIDYGTWKFGTDRAATYFSLYTFINKSVGALGGALALAIAGWVGFDPTATSHSDATVAGLRLGMVWIPALFILLSIVFIARIPITARRHEIIRRRLDSRLVRAACAMATPSQLDTKTDVGIIPNNPDRPNSLLQT